MLQKTGGDEGFASNLASSVAGGNNQTKAVLESVFSGEVEEKSGLLPERTASGAQAFEKVKIPKANPNNLEAVAAKMRRAVTLGIDVPFTKDEVISLEQYIEGMKDDGR